MIDDLIDYNDFYYFTSIMEEESPINSPAKINLHN